MFGIQFYPTPKELADKLFAMAPLKEVRNELKGYVSVLYDSVFDPSGGKGDLVDHYTAYVNRGSRYTEKVNAFFCEIDPNLSVILQEKGTVIGADFLEYTDPSPASLIIMNPPFAYGAKHVLHAWNLLYTGHLLAIVNAETIRNPSSNEKRMLANIIEAHGSVLYESGAFEQAERKTSVDVALICLHKPDSFDSQSFDFSFENEELDVDFSEISDSQQLAFVENKLVLYERMYNESKHLFVDALRSFTKLRRCLASFGAGEAPLEAVSKINIQSGKDYQSAYNTFIMTTRSKAWSHILEQGNFRSRLDSKTSQDFDRFVVSQKNMAYSVKNIVAVFEMIVLNQDVYQQRAIATAFDFLTAYTKENRVYFEGWKTNDAFKINSKVILPGGVRWGEYMNGRDKADRFRLQYGYQSQWLDIDKAMAICEGRNSIDNVVTIANALDRQFDQIGWVGSGSFDNECYSTYFKIRFYKKGTVHLYFKSQELLDRFNRMACEGKGWLPPSTPQADNTESENSSVPVLYSCDF